MVPRGPGSVLRFLLVFKDYSPVVGAGEELFFDLGVPAAAVQHGRVTLWGNTRQQSRHRLSRVILTCNTTSQFLYMLRELWLVCQTWISSTAKTKSNNFYLQTLQAVCSLSAVV